MPAPTPVSRRSSRRLPDIAHPLARFLSDAARAGWTRLASWAAFDALLIAGGTAAVGAWIAGWTLRGDLTAPAALGLAGTGAALWMAWLVRVGWRTFGGPGRTAASAARHVGPLRRGEPANATDRALREELLGAYELATAEPDTLRSPELAAAYVADVAERLDAPELDPALALPHPRGRVRILLCAAVAALWVSCLMTATGSDGLTLLWASHDGRPPEPPTPVWSSLSLELRYPEHTARPPRVVPNPSGALRVVAGTEVGIQLRASEAAAAAKAVLNYDPVPGAESPEPEVVDLEVIEESATPTPSSSGSPAGQQFAGTFVARGSGTWTIVLLDDDADDDAHDDAHDDPDAGRRSEPMPLLLEVDRAPDIELLPLPAASREVSEQRSVDIRFVARDDFGLSTAELVYQMPDGSTHRLSVGAPGARGRTWRHRYTWDLSTIPITERSDVLYWVEVRDNDPGLGLVALPDPPGKVTRSTTMSLVVKDDEAEHAANIVKLAQLRDKAVDLLAGRMTTQAFEAEATDAAGTPIPLAVRTAAARELLHGSGELLAMLALAVDALSMDTLTHERDVAILTAVHRRLKTLHDDELEAHKTIPEGLARREPERAEQGLLALAEHNDEERTQLEDEIIRLDDLVDGQIIERLEALVARLEATQRKLVDLLEQLKAGDETARAQIEQLEQRRKEDMRRIAEARAMLRQEIDDDFMNLDAFAVLESMRQQEQLSEMLRRGETDAALEAAKSQLGEVQQLRDAVQEKLGEADTGQPAVSEEDRQRMELLRELSRLQDEESTLRSQTRTLDQAWRDGVKDQTATKAGRDDAAKKAKELREALEKINDARLGRDARRGLEDAKAALESIESSDKDALGRDKETTQLELADAARKAADALRSAEQGSEAKEREGRALRRARGKAESLENKTRAPLRGPGEVLSEEQQEKLAELTRRQQGLRKRAGEVSRGESAKQLPKEGRQAMRDADSQMESSADELGNDAAGDAVAQQNGAWDALQRAIDSLRQGPPPPPPSSSSADASTEAERDRSLRDALMDAMKEDTPQGYDAPVKRYYEELLR